MAYILSIRLFKPADIKKDDTNKKGLIWLLVVNATFNNISTISWWPVLVVEEAAVPGENHRPLASNW